MKSKRHSAGLQSSNAGLTLVELLIYSVLMVVVLLVVGGILTSALRGQNTVSSTTQASTAGQLVSRSVGHGIRNASSVWHSLPGADPEILMARTMRSDAAGTWICQAWAFNGGAVRTTTSTGPISATQTATTLLSWTLLGVGMQSVSAGSAPIFTVTGNPVAPYIDPYRVDLNLEVVTAGSRPMLVQTSSVSRQPTAATGDPCFP